MISRKMPVKKIAVRIGVLIIVLFGVLALTNTQAQAQSGAIAESKEERILRLNNKLFRYELAYFENKYGEREIQISLIEAHWLAPDTRLVVLRGRDTDLDDNIDAWFYNEGQVVRSVKKVSKGKDAWPTARELLKNFSLNESRWISTLITREVLSDLFFSFQGELQDAKELEQMQIDLLDLDYKIASLDKAPHNSELSRDLKQVSDAGWKRLLERWNRTRIEDRHQRILGDAAVLVGGGMIFKGAKFLLVKSLSSETLTSLKGYLSKVLEQQKKWITKVSDRISKRVLQKNALVEGAMEPVRFASEAEALAFLSRKTFLSNSLRKLGDLLKNVAMGSWEQKGYIATSQVLQLAVESYSRGYWRFSDAPIVLRHPVESTQEFLQEVSQDKGLVQNMSYMTLQTTLLSGITEALSKKGAHLGIKYAVCSVITLIDSLSVGILIKGEPDAKRIGFDTGWELIVGGSQVQADLAFLKWAEGLAKKYNNPKLKVVGYLLASVDQFAGYKFYNVATSKYFEGDEEKAPVSELPPVVIVPVLAPQ